MSKKTEHRSPNEIATPFGRTMTVIVDMGKYDTRG